MVLINYYSHIDKEKETKSGNFKMVKEAFPDLDFTNCIILKSGKKIEADTELGKDEIIFIRKTPTAATTAAIVVGVISGVIGLAGLGFEIYGYFKNKQLQKELADAQKNNSDYTNVDALPFLKGANNQSANGRSFPLILGEHYHTPYRLAPKFYEVTGTKGENEYTNIILETAFSPLVIEKILIGENTIYENLTKSQADFVGGFPTNSIFYDAENKIEIRHEDDFTTEAFKKKIISDYIQTEIPHDYGTATADVKSVVHNAQPTAKSIDVVILFDGLRKVDDYGYTAQTVTINCWWSNVDNPDPKNAAHWNLLTFDQNGTKSNTFTYNSKKQMRFIAHKDFSPSESFGKNITVMVKRTTPCAESNSQEKCYLSFINTEVYDTKKSTSTSLVSCKPLETAFSEKCTRIGLRMKASSEYEDLSDSIHVVAYGCARTWDGDTWSLTKTPTRNPAAWALEVLTSGIHNLSKFSDSEIDLASCGRLYTYCEEHGYYCDAVITNPITKDDLLNNILLSCNASLIMNNDGLLEFFYDDVENYPVALLNTQDITDVTITKKMERHSDGKKVTFVNHGTWTAETRYVMKDGSETHNASDTITELTPSYVTDPSHAWKYARRQNALEEYQLRELSVTVGLEGGYYPLYSCVDVQLPQLSVGIISAYIVSLSITDGVLTEIELDQEVEFVEGKNYGLIAFVVKQNQKGFFTAKVSGLGRTRFLEVLDYNGVSPVAGNILSFGLLDNDGDFTLITSRMKIYNIKRNDNTYKLTLKDYSPEIYDDEGEIPTFKTNATIAPTARKTLDIVPEEVRTALDDQQEYIKDLVENIGLYTFDITPEYQTAACNSDGIPLNAQEFKFTATVYRSSKPFEGSVSYTAKVNNRTVGTWEGNVLTLDNSVVISDTNNILVEATTDDGYSFSAIVTIAKLRAGNAGEAKYTTYEIGLNEPFVKTDSDGKNPTPNHITATRLKKTEAFTVETSYGYITASVDGGEEQLVNGYKKVQSVDVFDAKVDYYKKGSPFYMTLNGDALSLNDVIMIGFKE